MSQSIRCAAFNTGTQFHELDHIAPLAELMQMPLFTTEEANYRLGSLYYPQVEVKYLPDLEYRLSEIAEQYDVLFECKYWAPHLKALFKQLYNKQMRLVFCPHGQSDKGFKAPLLAPYASQDVVLLYGELLIDMLKKLAIWPSISNYGIVGNFRLEFYQKHRSFYDNLVEQKFLLCPKKRTLLYAPTWLDADKASSFFNYGAKLISQLPADWNLMIKLHPLLEQRDPSYFYSIVSLAEKTPGVILIGDFPPVYPLLSRADIYLGDASSVGYDFLFFQKPLYFFPTSYGGRLHTCGRIIDPEKSIYLQLEQGNCFREQQKSLYDLAFGSPKPSDELRLEIHQLLKAKP